MEKAYNVLSGAHGKVYLDGLVLFEVENVSAEIEVMREDVMFGPDVDSKITGYKGSGNLTIKKIYSSAEKKLLEMVKSGRDFRPVLDVMQHDPNAVGGQREHVTIPGIWFNRFTLAGFKRGEVINRDFDFGFAPSAANLLEGVY